MPRNIICKLNHVVSHHIFPTECFCVSSKMKKINLSIFLKEAMIPALSLRLNPLLGVMFPHKDLM